ncbi:MAG: SpoIIE family protein phosphatase [Gemmataceae bacterium]
MASLTILKGGTPNQRIKLEVGEEFIMGRSPDCQIHIPNNAVSRQHAKIVRNQTAFFIEDLESRNGTFVNNQAIAARTQLKDNDKIKICDWMFAFHVENTPPPGPIEIDDQEGSESPSTVHASVGRMSQQQLLDTQPTDKLRMLLEVSTTLGKALKEEDLLPQIAESLFTVFKQADRCFVITRDENSEALIPKVIKARRANTETSARFSKTIVRKCLESGQSLLFEDAQAAGQMALSASIAEFRIRSVMCAPLVNQDGNAFGLIQLDSQDRNKTFTKDDLNLLIGVANQAAMALENAKLHKIALDMAIKQQDEELARKVQRSFLPAKLPEVAGYQFYAFYQAAKNVGGDYYDFIPNVDRQLGILLGDVAGKGMPAALLMAKLSAEARYCMLSISEIHKAVGRLNEQLLQAGMMDRFVTLAACLLDPVAHKVTFVNAGHMSPLIYRKASNTLEEGISNDKSGFPLGMMEGMEYDFTQAELLPGDSVIIFTDGVTDALSLQNAPFGNEGVTKAILADVTATPESHTPQQVGKRIIAAVQKHNAGQYQNDDIALVGFGRMESPLAPAESGRISTATGPMTQTMKRVPGMMGMD